jgi:hypothetical protein
MYINIIEWSLKMNFVNKKEINPFIFVILKKKDLILYSFYQNVWFVTVNH